MPKLADFIEEIIVHWRSRPQRLDISQMSERLRADLGMPEVLDLKDMDSRPKDPDIESRRDAFRAKRRSFTIRAILLNHF